MRIRFDCRHYVGQKPCKFKQVCDRCGHFEALGTRILVIKLGALGDCLRTTAILPALKTRFPQSQITWLTEEACAPLLQNIPTLDRIWVTDAFTTARLQAQSFDVVINLDKETPAPEYAILARATVKLGFGLSDEGALVALNEPSKYALQLGVDDDLKFRRNTKTYQQIIHEMAELKYPSPAPRSQFKLSETEIQAAQSWVNSQRPGSRDDVKILAINPGAGKAFATKKWFAERYVETISALYEAHGVMPMLLGGQDEALLIEKMALDLQKRKIPFIRPGENLTLREFAAILSQCDALLAGDTLAMHLALSFGIKTMVLFTSTCAQEIELFDCGKALVGSAPCAPCYQSRCNQPSQLCAQSISVDDVIKAVVQHMELDTGEKLRRCSNL